MERKPRLATFTVRVPLQFTFAADNNLDCEELFKEASKELAKRLENGYFDVVGKELEVVNKVTHYTREEVRQQNAMWREILWGVKR